MEISSKEVSKELIHNHIKALLLKKGYPANLFQWKKTFPFTYNGLTFEVELPLVLEDDKPLLILYYHPSKRGLTSFERPLLSIARLFFSPPPYFAVLTNLEDYILIEVYPQIIKRGGEEVFPDYESLMRYQPPFEKPYNKSVEEKILAFYLSGG